MARARHARVVTRPSSVIKRSYKISIAGKKAPVWPTEKQQLMGENFDVIIDDVYAITEKAKEILSNKIPGNARVWVYNLLRYVWRLSRTQPDDVVIRLGRAKFEEYRLQPYASMVADVMKNIGISDSIIRGITGVSPGGAGGGAGGTVQGL